ncbi:Uncharacterized protein TCM_023146 [Theobroma cacao]|uniref:Uncharacterized protein n=1 Tax=Theobroma cacao TaxID=3641 RepID=A0A061EU24_THECC|nr:Uncharacterized protein TCM_023146 [Theobroma cacao]
MQKLGSYSVCFQCYNVVLVPASYRDRSLGATALCFQRYPSPSMLYFELSLNHHKKSFKLLYIITIN